MASLIRQGRNHPNREGHTGSLWQGGADDVASGEHFDVIILCAEEFQPASHTIAKPGTQVVHAPNDDSGHPLTREQAQVAIAASSVAARAFREGKKVLSSCMQGRNRSGLVTALTLHRLYGLSGEKASAYVQQKRENALTNLYFVDFLKTIKARG